MTEEVVNVGSAPNDGTGDPARTAFQKINNNFNDLYPTSLGAMVLGGATRGSILELPAGTSAGQVLSMSSGASGLVPTWVTQTGGGGASQPVAFSVYMAGASPSFVSGSWTKIPFDTALFDTTGAFDVTTNHRFQPTVPGYYFFNGMVNYSSSPYLGDIAFYKNGTLVNGGITVNAYGMGGNTFLYLNGSTDYVEVFFRQLSGSNQKLESGSINTFFQGFLVQASAITAVPQANLLDNGDFRINQRVVSGTVTLAAGAYGHDRWKAGASGCTYTFAASGNGYELTISAGSLQQVVKGVDVEGGSYALWQAGSAQARIATGGGTPSGSYATASATSPILVSGVTGGQDITVEFTTGTVFQTQLEPGSVATSFEVVDTANMLIRCQRYFEKSYSQSVAPGTVTQVGQIYAQSVGSNIYTHVPFYAQSVGSNIYTYVPFKVTKQSTPSFTIYSPFDGSVGNIYDYTTSTNYASTLGLIGPGDAGFGVHAAPGGGATDAYGWHWVLSCEP